MEINIASVNTEYITEANILKKCFENLLAETVIFSNCAIGKDTLKSNEIVTNYTLSAESIASRLTGASINFEITKAELNLRSESDFDYTIWLADKTQDINCRTLNILEEAIGFKERILALSADCQVFVELYPNMLEHILKEAKLYYTILEYLIRKTLPSECISNELKFWNHIMKDHAEYIDGLLDPTEINLKENAEEFAMKFEDLVEESIKSNKKLLIQKSLKETQNIKDFKKTTTEGLLECKIKSIIPPLLADHILREAYHYIRILKEMKI